MPDWSHVAAFFAALASLCGVLSFVASKTPIALWITRQSVLVAQLTTANSRVADAVRSLQFAAFTRDEAQHLQERVEANSQEISRLERYVSELDAYSLKLEAILTAAGLQLPPGRPRYLGSQQQP